MTRPPGLSLRPSVLISLLLLAATFTCYWPVTDHDFLIYDDAQYVTTHPRVSMGLSWANVGWAFTSTDVSNWHPLTWLSFMLDVQLFGLRPGFHHFTSVVFHVANTLLLFFLLKRMTGDTGPSGLVAALFALHPLHVESVAWIAERKDVLSALFWFLGILAYVGYVGRKTAGRYLLVVLWFACGLMSKPMVVTFPFLLLVLDYWPLRRFDPPRLRGVSRRQLTVVGRALGRLVVEKLPLFALSAAASVVTFVVQKNSGAVGSVETFSLSARAANAVVAYATYLWKAVWPVRLSVLYPYRIGIPAWEVLGALAVLVVISAMALIACRSRPYSLAGWLWFLGTLVPVIGVVQVGAQSMADRYTYVPLVGLFIVVSWGLRDLIARCPHRVPLFGIAAAGVASACMVVSRIQVSHWRDTVSLFRHALAVTENNPMMHKYLGAILALQGRYSDAVEEYAAALRIKPDYAAALGELGLALACQGKTDEGTELLHQVLRIEPDSAEATYRLGLVAQRSGDAREAEKRFHDALRLRPDYTQAHHMLGRLLLGADRPAEATQHLGEAARLSPGIVDVHHHLGLGFESLRRFPDALEQFGEAHRRDPRYVAVAEYFTARVRARQGRPEDAVALLDRAIEHGFVEWDRLRTDEGFDGIRQSPEFLVFARRHPLLSTSPTDEPESDDPGDAEP